MNMIYYYPFYDQQAPSQVSRIIIEHLIKNEEKIPFTIKILASISEFEDLNKFVDDGNILTFKDLKNVIPKENVVHIPKSPFIAPNNRFRFFLWALHKNIPIISNYHGDFRVETRILLKNMNPLMYLSYMPSYILAPQLLRCNDWLIVNSFWMKELLGENYGLIENIKVIPNGIDDWWFQDGNKLSLEGNPNLFYHGRLSYEKGVHLLVQAFSSIKIKSRNNAKLYIAGTGPLRDKLIKDTMKLGLKKDIIFLGYVPLSELRMYLQSADAIIYPSIYEPFSIAVLEALSAARAAVFVSNNVGLLTFADQNLMKDIVSFNPNIHEITNIIENIIQNVYDNNVYKIQKDFAKRFLWKKIILEYIKFYRDIHEKITSGQNS